MRDHVVVYFNGQRCVVRGVEAFLTLSELLRERRRLVGTKVVCAEGDCGACSVLVGEPRKNGAGAALDYRPIDACITFPYQVDGYHVVTVEGLRGVAAGDLHPVQRALVDAYGSQCGFCTPGFVIALAGLFEDCAGDPPSGHQVRRALAGNLCRCTGYWQIFEAAQRVDAAGAPRLDALYHDEAMLAELQERGHEAVLVEHGERRVFVPDGLECALQWRAEHPAATVVAGATDLAVARNKGKRRLDTVLALSQRLPGFGDVGLDAGGLRAGAGATLNRLLRLLDGGGPAGALGDLARVLETFGAVQIRHHATLGGNVINASPIADTLPFLYVTEAILVVQSRRGTRRIPIGEFYTGYKRFDLRDDELLVAIEVPPLPAGATLHLFKMSRRRDLDIASFTAGALREWRHDAVASARLAMGGVGETVRRLPHTEALLAGRRFDLEAARAAGRRARAEIAPISDVRGSAEYRLQLAENTLVRIHHQRAAERAETPLPSTAVA